MVCFGMVHVLYVHICFCTCVRMQVFWHVCAYMCGNQRTNAGVIYHVASILCLETDSLSSLNMELCNLTMVA